jgi:hypothetical protein
MHMYKVNMFSHGFMMQNKKDTFFSFACICTHMCVGQWSNIARNSLQRSFKICFILYVILFPCSPKHTNIQLQKNHHQSIFRVFDWSSRKDVTCWAVVYYFVQVQVIWYRGTRNLETWSQKSLLEQSHFYPR